MDRRSWLNLLIFAVFICMLLAIMADQKLNPKTSPPPERQLFTQPIERITWNNERLSIEACQQWQAFTIEAQSHFQQLPAHAMPVDILYKGAHSTQRFYLLKATKQLLLFDPVFMVEYRINPQHNVDIP